MSGWRKFSEFLGLRRNTTLLLVALVFAGTGEKLWLGFAPKYLETLGMGAGLAPAVVLFLICFFFPLQKLFRPWFADSGLWFSVHFFPRRLFRAFHSILLGG